MDYRNPLAALIPGAEGAILAVLTRATQPLTLRQIADRADVSPTQAGRRVDHLEHLGIVRRRIAGRSHLIEMTESLVARDLRALSRIRERVIDHLRDTAVALDPQPISIVLFGSFARGQAGPDSDIDLLVVIDPDRHDAAWRVQLLDWTAAVSAFAGSPVSDIELPLNDIRDRIDAPLHASIRDDGITVSGVPIDDLYKMALSGVAS